MGGIDGGELVERFLLPVEDLINNPFTPSELEERNVLFMDEGWENYLPKLFKQMLK